MKKLLISALLLLFFSLFSYSKNYGMPPGVLTTQKLAATTGCAIPDTVLYEAEHGILVGSGLSVVLRTNASNDTNVSTINYTNKGVQFIMLYDADAIKLCHSGYQTGGYGFKINGVSQTNFSITSSGGWNNIRETQVNATVHAGDTVFVYSYSGAAVIEIDCIKAYKAPNKKPYISISTPVVNDTFSFYSPKTLTAAVNDTDGTITSVKFFVNSDTTYTDATAPYSFTYTPKTFGHKSLTVTAYDNCGDSTVLGPQIFYLEDTAISTLKYEAEYGIFVGASVSKVYRAGVSNDTNATNINYSGKGIKFVMTTPADGIILGYGGYQTGKFSFGVNGTFIDKFTIIRSGAYEKILNSPLAANINIGDTVFVYGESGFASLEIDYIKAYRYVNVAPTVSITNPNYGDTLYLDSTYTFAANANDTDGIVDSVKFLIDGIAVGTDNSAPFTYSYLADSSGWKTISAVAYDNGGDSGVSTVNNFLVRTIIPDTLLYEAERGVLVGSGLETVKRISASNDTTVRYINYTDKGVKFKLLYDATSIKMGYSGYNAGTFGCRINGVSQSNFSIAAQGGWDNIGEAELAVTAHAGDTVFFHAISGGVSLEIDYLKAYNPYGFVHYVAPIIVIEPDSIVSIPENEDWDYVVTTVLPGSSIRKDTLDGKKFTIINDTTVITQYSFDYEDQSEYTFILDSGNNDLMYQVNITNVTGNFDTNGFADSAIAAKYTGVNVGDYIYWNFTTGKKIEDYSKITVDYPNKVLIHGKKYQKITIDLDNAEGNSTSEPIVVTNFLGQVEFRDGFAPKNVNAIRLTGKYDSTNGYGHRYFKGWDQGYEFSHGTFGIYGNNHWLSENSHHIDLNTPNNKVELDYIEVCNGGFAGVSWKEDHAPFTINDSSKIHHCFVHDIGSEGLYLGSTGNDSQQVFRNFVAENNLFLRCGGEGIQMGWQMGGCVARNNVVHSGFDWKFPFQPYQDGVIQFSAIGGGSVMENNILMGGGEQLGLIEVKRNTTPYSIVEDTIHFRNSLIYGIRGGMLTHLLKYGDTGLRDSMTHVVYDGNYYKQIGGDYAEVGLLYGEFDTAKSSIFDIRTYYNDVIVRNCLYDNTADTLFRKGTGHRVADTANNLLQELPYPQFRNYLGLSDTFNYLNMSRYTDSAKHYNNYIKDTIVATWEVGNIVQHWNSNGDTRFYLCVAATSNPANRPPNDDTDNVYWELLSWTKGDGSISYFPPDDVRLDAGSHYDTLGMGIEDVNPSGSSLIRTDKSDKSQLKSDLKNQEAASAAPQNMDDNTNTITVFECAVYPNPSQGVVNISSNVGMLSVAVYDVLGKQYVNHQLMGATTTNLNLQTLSNGLYLVQVKSINGETVTKKIQVSK